MRITTFTLRGKKQSNLDGKKVCKKIQFGVGESFTSNWKLNRQKGCFSELANSLEVTVNFSLQNNALSAHGFQKLRVMEQ